jgi:MFS family permease
MPPSRSGCCPIRSSELVREPLLTRPYLLICLLELAGYLNNNLVTPVVPLLVASQGGSEVLVGLVLGAFSVTSFLLRPFVGLAVDTLGAGRVLRDSMVTLGLCGLGYLISNSVALFLVRGAHGIGWAGLNTAASVLVSQTAPASRRAEALGYFTTVQALASTVGAPIALWLVSASGFSSVFFLSAACGLLSVLGVRLLPASHHERPRRVGGLDWEALFDTSTLLPATLLFLSTATNPAAQAFVVLYAGALGVSPLWLYFLAYGLTTIVGRGLLGRLSDQLGRTRVLLLALALGIVGLALLARATTMPELLLGGVVHALGQALTLPNLLALAVDLAHPRRRGAAMATYTSANQLGVGAGAMLGGVVIERAGYGALYLSAIGPLVVAAIVLMAVRRSA